MNGIKYLLCFKTEEELGNKLAKDPYFLLPDSIRKLCLNWDIRR